jgi:3-hydroxymyristoyl/3-hydroxydecanoyl-(acyl carrier protein) dehydratase
MDKQNMKTVYEDIKNSFQGQKDKDFVFKINGDFIAFKGHFPEQPLLPGIVQIEIVLFCIRKLLNNETANISEIIKAKFVKPILPDTQIVVSIEMTKEICRAVIKNAQEIYSQMQLKTSSY